MQLISIILDVIACNPKHRKGMFYNEMLMLAGFAIDWQELAENDEIKRAVFQPRWKVDYQKISRLFPEVKEETQLHL